MILAVHHKYNLNTYQKFTTNLLFSISSSCHIYPLLILSLHQHYQSFSTSSQLGICLSLSLSWQLSMASLIFKERKGMNFSCTAPASTAVCTSIDRRSIIQPSSSRYLDRYTPHLRDPLRSKTTPTSTKSLLPTSPSTSTTLKQKTVKHKHKGANNTARRSLDILTVSAEKPSPPVSSRYLLNSERFSDVYAESELVPNTPELPPLLIMGPQPTSTEISEESAENTFSTDAKSSPTHGDKPKDQVCN